MSANVYNEIDENSEDAGKKEEEEGKKVEKKKKDWVWIKICFLILVSVIFLYIGAMVLGYKSLSGPWEAINDPVLGNYVIVFIIGVIAIASIYIILGGLKWVVIKSWLLCGLIFLALMMVSLSIWPQFNLRTWLGSIGQDNVAQASVYSTSTQKPPDYDVYYLGVYNFSLKVNESTKNLIGRLIKLPSGVDCHFSSSLKGGKFKVKFKDGAIKDQNSVNGDYYNTSPFEIISPNDQTITMKITK